MPVLYTLEKALPLAKERRAKQPDQRRRLEEELRKVNKEVDALVALATKGKAPAAAGEIASGKPA